jgi:hypothetical protein
MQSLLIPDGAAVVAAPSFALPPCGPRRVSVCELGGPSAPRRATDPRKRVVITGMGLVSVFGNDVGAFYDRLLAGQSGVVPIDRFDASGFSTRFAAQPDQRLLLRRPERTPPRRLPAVRPRRRQEGARVRRPRLQCHENGALAHLAFLQCTLR